MDFESTCSGSYVLALNRQAVRIARHAFQGTDAYLRGTALEYLDTVLPPSLVARLLPKLGASRPSCRCIEKQARACQSPPRPQTITVRREDL